MIIKGPGIYAALIGVLIASAFIIVALSKMPPKYRRRLITSLVFLSGLFYVLEFFLPTHPETQPNGSISQVNILTPRIIDIVTPMAATLAAFLLGLGLYSLVRIHGNNVVRQRPGWINSLALLVAACVMLFFGFWAQVLPTKPDWVEKTYDHLFSGFYQNMNSAMFSIISFFILSASYRAFRIRNMESSILMLSALVVLLGLSFGVLLTSQIPETGFLANLRMETWSSWVLSVLSIPSLRAIDFGVGLGALAMGLRIWLGIERGALFAD
jgi:hypothetical protein